MQAIFYHMILYSEYFSICYRNSQFYTCSYSLCYPWRLFFSIIFYFSILRRMDLQGLSLCICLIDCILPIIGLRFMTLYSLWSRLMDPGVGRMLLLFSAALPTCFILFMLYITQPICLLLIHLLHQNLFHILLIFRSQTMKNNLKQMIGSVAQLVKNNPKTSLAIALPILLGIIIRKQQRRIIYLPQIPGLDKSPSNNPHPYRNPAEFGLPNSRDIQIKTNDNIMLRGWYVSPSNKKPSRLILYYQQNAGNIGARLPFVKHLVEQTNSDVMLVAYRGYSDSQGVPSQKGLKNDGISILNVAIKESNQRNIPLVVLGRSLGGAVAIYCCSQQKIQSQVKGLVLENTFTSISDVGLNLFSTPKTRFIVKLLFLFLLSNHWESYKLIEKIKAPTLFIKSALDELIPIAQMNKLEEICQSKKTSYVIRRGTHNESWSLQFEEYFNQLNRFLSSL